MSRLARMASGKLPETARALSERAVLPVPEATPETAAAFGQLAGSYARLAARRAPGLATGVGFTALATVGLGPVASDVRATGPLFDAALAEAFGPGWQGAVARPAWLQAEPARRREGPFGAAVARRRYALGRDQRYGDGPRGLLDVWRRPDLPPGAQAPIVLQIPGGAWVMGSRRGQAHPLMSHLVGRGWICASMSYRLSPRHAWPAHVVDVKRAIGWLRRHAASFGGDGRTIVVTGGSAGGHLAALAALTPGDVQFQPGFEQVDTSVAAAVPLYGRYDWVAREGEGREHFMRFLERVVVKQRQARAPHAFEAASPLHRIRADAPPFLVVHGRSDTIIPIEQGRQFAATLRVHSDNPVAWVELPGAHHAFDVVATRRTARVCQGVGDFLGVVLGNEQRRLAALPATPVARAHA